MLRNCDLFGFRCSSCVKRTHISSLRPYRSPHVDKIQNETCHSQILPCYSVTVSKRLWYLIVPERLAVFDPDVFCSVADVWQSRGTKGEGGDTRSVDERIWVLGCPLWSRNQHLHRHPWLQVRHKQSDYSSFLLSPFFFNHVSWSWTG